MAVDRIAFLRDRGAASLALVAAVAAGGAMFACSSDSSKSEDSGSDSATGQNTNSTNTTSPNTSGGANNNNNNNNTITSGPGGTNTSTTTGGGGGSNGAGNATSNGNGTTGNQNTTSPNTTSDVSTTGATTGTIGSCGLSVDSHEISSEIATVGIVTWSATSEIESAEIKFGPAGGEMTMSAPVDLAEPNYRTLVLGMKPDSEYQAQVVAQSGGAACSSDTFTFTTGSAPNDVPLVTHAVQQEGKGDPGFYVTVAYARGGYAFIFDADGDPVWWAPASPGPEPSGVRMDYEGKAIWTCSGNPSASGMGRIRRISMDGMDVKDLANTYDAHHDLAPLPGGSVAALIHSNGDCASIIEVHPDMTVTDIVPDVTTLYTPVQQCHPNSILYHPEDESFTVSDRNPNLYVKFDRASGEVQWQFGGANPVAATHFQETWNTNHGHHLLPNGNFLFFNNNGKGGGGSASPVWEYELDAESATATEVWGYTSATNDNTAALGDVQRLENGNTLITYSISGVVHEVDGDSQLVQTYKMSSLGYLQHRRSLYGAPPK